jgi:hypothetical protein
LKEIEGEREVCTTQYFYPEKRTWQVSSFDERGKEKSIKRFLEFKQKMPRLLVETREPVRDTAGHGHDINRLQIGGNDALTAQEKQNKLRLADLFFA